MNLIGRNLCATAAHRAFPFFFSLILFIGTLLAPPLPTADRLTLAKLFGHLSGVGLDPPWGMPGSP